MKKLLTFTLAIIITIVGLKAQEIQFYNTEEGDKHIWGEFPVDYLKEDTTYSSWYNDNYEGFTLEKTDYDWIENLEDDSVEIYLGTWCGDSQEWVPQFLKLWDELGLNRDQLKFTALYGSGDDYKQGPNGEEEGLNIHRVPTFIFKENGEEYARIVESPSTDLLTDVAQIALGYPSAPNYRGATYMLQLFDTMSVDEIYKDIQNVYRTAYYKVGRFAEFNTLGKVLSTAGKKYEALLVFQFNTYYHPGNWYGFKSYGELLVELENYPEAIKAYDKLLALNPENEEAKAELERLNKLVPEEKEVEEKSAGGN